ncbi:tyrosine kinase receptor Cad96Ca-like, partial [Anneissia japonica]|uniref:tyrosine kinase receptor Cad96Ca-like n=1 Tax=Anneissia japonica TaxID=1529436 RepID=UPI001425B51C
LVSQVVVPILPVVPQEPRPVSSGSTTPPVPLPKKSKRKSLCRKNTVNMNTYINGWDASKWELSRDQLSIDDTPLASGYFGDVFKARLDVWTGKEKSVNVVVKTLRNQSSNRDKAQFLKELATHALIEPHVNIVRLIGCCTKSAPLLMVLEYVENGSLSDYLFNKEIDVDQGRKNLVCFGHQIADGMAYLSEMKVGMHILNT